jgi:hypothetical protein
MIIRDRIHLHVQRIFVALKMNELDGRHGREGSTHMHEKRLMPHHILGEVLRPPVAHSKAQPESATRATAERDTEQNTNSSAQLS